MYVAGVEPSGVGAVSVGEPGHAEESAAAAGVHRPPPPGGPGLLPAAARPHHHPHTDLQSAADSH